MLPRTILALVFVLVAGVHVVRTAAVAALAEDRPAAVATFWPDHPEVLRSVAMARVGEAAGAGRAPSSEAMQQLAQLATAEPLSAEPFLVQGAIAQRNGDLERAERLLFHARNVEPRSAAARFLLADLYIRNGRVLPGLSEMSVLGRLVPGGLQQVAPSLAAYAVSAGGAPQLERILRRYPELKAPVLEQLAQDPANAGFILSVAGAGHAAEPREWQRTLLRKMVEQGSFARAQLVWSRLSGVPLDGSSGLFNPGFREIEAPPPFNWSLESSGKGVAESADGGLRILYFGRDNAALASQLMLLPAGSYRLQMRVSGQIGPQSGVGWTVTCLPDGSPILELPLGRRPSGEGAAADFSVPASGCPAQMIELQGRGREFPETADFRIGDLQLTRIGG